MRNLWAYREAKQEVQGVREQQARDKMAMNGLVRIQNRTRQREAEKMLKDWKKGAVKVQAVFRGMQDRAAVVKLRFVSATAIQSQWRRVLDGRHTFAMVDTEAARGLDTDTTDAYLRELETHGALLADLGDLKTPSIMEQLQVSAPSRAQSLLDVKSSGLSYKAKHHAWLIEQKKVEQPKGLPPLPEAPPVGYYSVQVEDLEVESCGVFDPPRYALSARLRGALRNRLCLVMDGLAFPVALSLARMPLGLFYIRDLAALRSGAKLRAERASPEAIGGKR